MSATDMTNEAIKERERVSWGMEAEQFRDGPVLRIPGLAWIAVGTK